MCECNDVSSSKQPNAVFSTISISISFLWTKVFSDSEKCSFHSFLTNSTVSNAKSSIHHHFGTKKLSTDIQLKLTIFFLKTQRTVRKTLFDLAHSRLAVCYDCHSFKVAMLCSHCNAIIAFHIPICHIFESIQCSCSSHTLTEIILLIA